jgi:hypothetical protein
MESEQLSTPTRASGPGVLVVQLIQMQHQLPTSQQPPASMSSLLQLYKPLTNPETEQSSA